jgi:hypothetical protein
LELTAGVVVALTLVGVPLPSVPQNFFKLRH